MLTATAFTATQRDNPSSKEVCLFLADYAVSLLGSGATCIRLEKNILRMASAFGKKSGADYHAPTYTYDRMATERRRPVHIDIVSQIRYPISFSLNTTLSRLSWRVADEGLSLDETEKNCLRRQRRIKIIHGSLYCWPRSPMPPSAVFSEAIRLPCQSSS